ncbi:MAG: phage Gp37/Gp68 family protein, partial [Gracilimonas sp.]
LTWNPVTGCSKVSQGCKFCYAEVMSRRLKAMGLEKYKNGFKVTIHPDTLDEPYSWKKSRVVFVNSMSDLFHEDVPIDFIQEVFRVMKENPRHVFQILTKRTELMLEYDQAGLLDWADNIWMGTSVEDERVMQRIDTLRQTKAHTKFLSCEPLIGPLPNMNLSGIDWVIVGGESGHNPRPMKAEWVIDIKEQCKEADVPFFFKQWGGRNKKKNGRKLLKKNWDEMPEMPEAFAVG